MQTIKEFGGPTPQMSVRKFWWTSGPILAAILLLTVVVVCWRRPWAEKLKEKLGLSSPKGTGQAKEQIPTAENPKPDAKKNNLWYRRKKPSDEEAPNAEDSAPAQLNSHEQVLVDLPPPHQKEENGG